MTVDYATADGSAAAPGDYAAGSGTAHLQPGPDREADHRRRQRRHHRRDDRDLHRQPLQPVERDHRRHRHRHRHDHQRRRPPHAVDRKRHRDRGQLRHCQRRLRGHPSAASSSTVTVDYSTFDGSAVAPGDYVAASGTLTFTAGQTAKQIVVAVKGDTAERDQRDLHGQPGQSDERDHLRNRNRDGDDHERRRSSHALDQQRHACRGQLRDDQLHVHGHPLRRQRPARHGRLRNRGRLGDRAR